MVDKKNFKRYIYRRSLLNNKEEINGYSAYLKRAKKERINCLCPIYDYSLYENVYEDNSTFIINKYYEYNGMFLYELI